MTKLTDIEYKEFSVAEVMEILRQAETDEGREEDAGVLNSETVINLMLPEGADANAMAKCTGLSVTELVEFLPSELFEIQGKVGEANAFFLSMIQRLAQIGKGLQERRESVSAKV